MNDIEIIYNELKDKYPLVLANSLTLNEGFSWNVPVICGKRKNAKFFLYADKNTLSPSGEEFVFSVVYTTPKNKELPFNNSYHDHPQTIKDAVSAINDFYAN